MYAPNRRQHIDGVIVDYRTRTEALRFVARPRVVISIPAFAAAIAVNALVKGEERWTAPARE
jgi:hypothetical protein